MYNAGLLLYSLTPPSKKSIYLSCTFLFLISWIIIHYSHSTCAHIIHLVALCLCSPHQINLVEGFRVAGQMNGMDDMEVMDTTTPTIPKRSTSPAIATKNTTYKQAAYPGAQNRPPHLRMNWLRAFFRKKLGI